MNADCRSIYLDFYLASAFGNDIHTFDDTLDRLRLVYIQDVLDLSVLLRYLDVEQTISVRLNLHVDELLYWTSNAARLTGKTKSGAIAGAGWMLS